MNWIRVRANRGRWAYMALLGDETDLTARERYTVTPLGPDWRLFYNGYLLGNFEKLKVAKEVAERDHEDREAKRARRQQALIDGASLTEIQAEIVEDIVEQHQKSNPTDVV